MAHLPAWYQYAAAPAQVFVAPEWREYRGAFPPAPPMQYVPAQYNYRNVFVVNEGPDLGAMWPVPPREPARIQAVDRPMGIHPSLGFLRNPDPAGIHVAIDMSRPSVTVPLAAVEYRRAGGMGARAAELPQATERMPAFDQETRRVHILVQFETGAGLGRFTWATTIETDRAMTVRSLVEALHRKLYEPVGEEELAFAARKDAWTREKNRRLGAHAFPEGDMRKVCRVDMLGPQHVFRGLYRDPGFEDIIAAKYGRDSDDAAIAWIAEFRAP